MPPRHSTHSRHSYPSPTPTSDPSLILHDSVPWFPLQSMEIFFEITHACAHITLLARLCQQTGGQAQIVFAIPLPWAAAVHSCEFHDASRSTVSLPITLLSLHEAALAHSQSPWSFLLFQDRTLGHCVWIRSLPHLTPAHVLIRYDLPIVQQSSLSTLQIPLRPSPPPLNTPPPNTPPSPWNALSQLIAQTRRVSPSHPLLPPFKIRGILPASRTASGTFRSPTHHLQWVSLPHQFSIQTLGSRHRIESVFALQWTSPQSVSESRKVYLCRSASHSTTHAWISLPRAHPQCILTPQLFPTLAVVLDLPAIIPTDDLPKIAALLSLLSCLSHSAFETASNWEQWLAARAQHGDAHDTGLSTPTWIHLGSSLSPDVHPSIKASALAALRNAEPLIWITSGTAHDERMRLSELAASHPSPIHLILLGWPHDEARLREWILSTRGTWADLRSWGEPPESSRAMAAWIQCLIPTMSWVTEPVLETSPDLHLGYGPQPSILIRSHSQALPRFITRPSSPLNLQRPTHENTRERVALTEFLEMKNQALARMDSLAQRRAAESDRWPRSEPTNDGGRHRGLLCLDNCFVGHDRESRAEMPSTVVVQPWSLESTGTTS